VELFAAAANRIHFCGVTDATLVNLECTKMSPLKFAPAGLLLASLVSTVAFAAPLGPFAALTGNWTGSGTIDFKDGHSERLRCRATEAGGQGDTLQLSLRCASDSYTLDLSSDVTYHSGAISGTWSEATHNAQGPVTGHVNGNQIDVSARGQNFAANLRLTTQGNRQVISINAAGSEISEVMLEMSRR
jgi:hypothetical protein